MAIRKTKSIDQTGRLTRLEAKNARRHELGADLAADVIERTAPRRARRRDGAVDPAHRLLAGAPPRD